MTTRKSVVNLPELESVIDRYVAVAHLDTSVVEAIALISQDRENKCELWRSELVPTLEGLKSDRRSNCILIIEEDKLVGIFTERDVLKLVASQKELNGLTLAEILSKKLVTLKESKDVSILTALSLLNRYQIRHLPILDDREHLKGLITFSHIQKILQSKNLLKMQTIGETMTTDVIYALPTASVLSLARTMEAHQISCVVVVEESEEALVSEKQDVEVAPCAYPQTEDQKKIADAPMVRPIGIITEGDIVQFQVLELNLSRIQAQEVMSTPLFTLKPEDFLSVAYTEMQKRRTSRLVITGERGELQGIITETNLIQAIEPIQILDELENLQQQVEEQQLALERSHRELEQEIANRQQLEDELKQLKQRLETLEEKGTAPINHLFDSSGSVYGMCGISTDITERKQGEQKLRETLRSLEFQKYALDRAAIVAITDRHGVITYANDRFCQISKYKREELVGQTHRIVNSGYHRPEFFQALWKTIANGNVWQGEIKNKAKDGSFYWVETTIVPFLDEIGKPFQYLAIRFDISDRKRAEEALRQSEHKFRAIFDGTFGFIGLLNTEGIVIEANRAALDAIDAELADVVGQPFWQTPWWTHSPQLQALLQQAILRAAAGELVRFEAEHILANGSSIFVDFSLKPVVDEAGKVVMLIPEGRDISDRKRGEAERKQAEQKIREQAALLEVATDAILVRDLENRIKFWNKGAERIYGWQATEAIDQDVRSLLYKEVSPQIETAYSTVLEKGEWQGELRKIAKTGKEVITASRWTLIRDEAGNSKFILSVDTDITDKKLLEAQFLRAQRLESLGTLASGIAHDMNNVLTPILGVAQLLPLKLPKLDLQNQRLLQILRESAVRGADLVQQILSFARGAEGERTSIQIAHILQELVKVARQTFPKSIEISLNLPNELWLVFGDATQLHQVLMNLCINARDALPEGGTLEIAAENLQVDESYARIHLDAKVGSYVVVTVTDTGVGIPPENIERIFEPFFSTKAPGKGTGLGLSTVIGIIKSHQGFVNVYSQIGKGTSFKIYLPAEENIEITESVRDLESIKGNEALILVVDDEASIREITRSVLESYNYRVITASDGIEAIALYAQHRDDIAVVLLDLMMPSLNTPTIIRTLERINPQIQIIAMSGLSINEQVTNPNYASVRAFLAKPFTTQNLLKTLSVTLE